MAIQNAGIGALEHGNSVVTAGTHYTTNSTFFDSDYCDRALVLNDSFADPFLLHTPIGESRTTTVQWFRCMLYIPTAPQYLLIAQILAQSGQFISLTGTGSVLRFSWRPGVSGAVLAADEGVDFATLPRDTLFEFAMVMEQGQGARFYIDGNLRYQSASQPFSGPFTFGGTSLSRAGVFFRNARPGNIYMSEPIVATEDIRDFRVQDMALSLGAQKTTNNGPSSANVDLYRNPGALFTSNGTAEEFAPGERSVYSLAPVGLGRGVGSPRSLLVSAAAFDRRDDTLPPAFFPRIRPYFRRVSDGASAALGSDETDSYSPWDSAVFPTDGEALGHEFPTNPLTGTDWSISDFPDTEVGGWNQETTGFARWASFQPVLIWGGSPPADPLDGALVTSSVSYTIQQDVEQLQDLFGLKNTQAVSYTVYQDTVFLSKLLGAGASQATSYTVFRKEEEPVLDQAISYTVGSIALPPRVSQVSGYSILRDDVFLARVAGAKVSSTVSYAIYGPDGAPDVSQAVSYSIGRLGDQPLATGAINYVILGAGDPATLIQGISYTVYAPPPDAPFIPTIIIGRSRY